MIGDPRTMPQLRVLSLMLVSAGMFALAPSSRAQTVSQARDHGPIRARSQFLATLPFLAIPADDAWMLNQTDLRLAIRYSHSNTFVKSGRILEHLPVEHGRAILSEETVKRVVQESSGQDEFLLDGEAGRFTLGVQYGLSSSVMIEAEIPILHFGGGFFDGMIENFHGAFGFSDAGRSRLPRNTSVAFLYLDGQQVFRDHTNLEGAGLGDVVLASKFKLATGNEIRPFLAARVAIKLPTGSYEKLRGSGSIDYGLQLLLSKLFNRNSVHLNLGWVVPGKWRLVPNLGLSPAYSAMLGYERLLGEKTAVVIQTLINTSLFRKATRSPLARTSYEVTAGVRFERPQGLRWTLSLTENYAYFDNSPDFGLQLGFERLF